MSEHYDPFKRLNNILWGFVIAGAFGACGIAVYSIRNIGDFMLLVIVAILCVAAVLIVKGAGDKEI